MSHFQVLKRKIFSLIYSTNSHLVSSLLNLHPWNRALFGTIATSQANNYYFTVKIHYAFILFSQSSTRVMSLLYLETRRKRKNNWQTLYNFALWSWADSQSPSFIPLLGWVGGCKVRGWGRSRWTEGVAEKRREDKHTCTEREREIRGYSGSAISSTCSAVRECDGKSWKTRIFPASPDFGWTDLAGFADMGHKLLQLKTGDCLVFTYHLFCQANSHPM